MTITNERLENNYKIALEVVNKVIGEKEVKANMRRVLSVSISPRAVKRHGCCKYENNNCRIEVSKHLFNFEDKEMITTLIHEILHTFKDTQGHNYKWQWYAKKITNNTEYTITRTRNIVGDKGHTTNDNYRIECCGCGNIHKQTRMTSHRKYCYANNYMRCCRCGSTTFKVEDLRNGETIC